ncbi:MAG: 2TM domain-containing protein [Sulfolobales archaeon]
MSSLDDFKNAWKKLEIEEAKSDFLAHFTSYVIVNMFLLFVNLYTTPRHLWFLWVLAAWGVGLAFHYVFSRERFVVSNWEKKVAKIEFYMRKSSRD